jgi:predicted metal-dependent peptidase
MSKQFEERLSLVSARMTIYEPFIAAVMTKLPRKVVQSGTAYTNGSEVAFAEPFCEPLDDDQLFGLMLHEAMHVVFMHMWRRESRDPYQWNVATDAVINAYIRSKRYSLPDGGVFIPWVTPEMDAETVYAKLQQEGGNTGKGEGTSGDGQPQPGESAPGDDGALEDHGGWGGTGDLQDAVDEAQEADIRAGIMTAAKMAKACGDKSALVERILGGGLTPKVHWADEVRAILTSNSKDDFTYQRVNRRMLTSGVYLPAMHSPAMGGLVIGFDTSFSVGPAEANQIAAEIQGIVDDLCPEWVEVVYCDTKVAGTQRFERGDELTLEVKGGGGTRFKPVFDYANALNEQVAALIYLTDMCGPLDELEPPDYPVIWGNVYGHFGSRVPFGKEVRVIV